jgi:hypothetical protein
MGHKPLIQFARMLVFFFFLNSLLRASQRKPTKGVNYKDLPQTSELHQLKCNYHLSKKVESLFFFYLFTKRLYTLEVHGRSQAESNLYFMETAKAKLYIQSLLASLQMPISSPSISKV